MKRVNVRYPSSRLSNTLVFSLCSCLIHCAILLWLAPWPTAARDIWINGLAGCGLAVLMLPILWPFLFLLVRILSKLGSAFLSLFRWHPPPIVHTWREIWAVAGAVLVLLWLLLIVTLNTIVITGMSLAYHNWIVAYFDSIDANDHFSYGAFSFLSHMLIPPAVWVFQMVLFFAYIGLDRRRRVLPPVTLPTGWIMAVLIAISLSGLVLYNQVIPRYTLSQITPFLETYLVDSHSQPAFSGINRNYGIYHVRGYHTFSDGSMHFILSQPFPRFNRNEVVGLAYRPNPSGSYLTYSPLNSDWSYFELKTKSDAEQL